jgi:hypothetical protein
MSSSNLEFHLRSSSENELETRTRVGVNTSGKAGAQVPHLPLGDDSNPWGR